MNEDEDIGEMYDQCEDLDGVVELDRDDAKIGSRPSSISHRHDEHDELYNEGLASNNQVDIDLEDEECKNEILSVGSLERQI